MVAVVYRGGPPHARGRPWLDQRDLWPGPSCHSPGVSSARKPTRSHRLATLRLATHPDPAALLEFAAGPFLRRVERRAGPFPSPTCLLALRQGGLRDDLYALAAARGIPGWFDPGICVFHELPQWLGATQLRPLGEFERVALIEHLLQREGRPLFAGRESAFLAAVDRLVGELVAEGVSPEQYDAAVAALAGRQPFEQTRDLTLARVYRAYVDELARLGRRDGRDALADSARALLVDPVALSCRLGARRELRVLGLADLKGGWRMLLDALLQSPALDAVVLYATHPLALPSPLARGVLIEPAAGPARAAGRIDAVAAPDPDAELEHVAVVARRLIERGAAPHRIAVIARDGRPYVDLAVRALERAGVPATARRRIGLLEIPVVRAVLALLQASARGWTRRDLVELGSQPYFASDIDTRIINYLGFRERIAGLDPWRAALDRLLKEARAAESALGDEGERGPPSLPAGWVERARDRFEAFAGIAGAATEPRTFSDWLAWLDDWLARDPWRIERRIGRVAGERWDVLRLDLLGWRQLRTVLGEWRAAREQWPADDGTLTALRFLDRLRAGLAGDVALYTETRRGVQVQEALAASHRSFDHVFLVGMNAGAFPRSPPSSMVLSERDREALCQAGLPVETSAEWEEREQALFDTLVGAARASLTLTWVSRDELGGAANPSSFADLACERLGLVPREPEPEPLRASGPLAAHAARVAVIERGRAIGQLSPWNGLIESPNLAAWLASEYGDERTWSPTSLEAYAKCPWAWFSERLLRLQVVRDPDDDMDFRVRGSVLHDALRRFYGAARERTGGPVALTSADQAWALPALREALGAALDVAGATLWLGHPALRDAKQAELARLLERYLEFEIEENEKGRDGRTTAGRTVRTAVEAHEIVFDGLTLERRGGRLRYRGIIDRIEVGVDQRVPGSWVAAVDYKTSRYAAPAAGDRAAWKDGAVLQAPLYAHALARLWPGARVARVEYRALKHARRLHVLNLVRVRKGRVEDDPEALARMEAALDAAVRHAGAVRAGEFSARPAPSCGCPPFCHGRDICRVAGGPRTGGASWT